MLLMLVGSAGLVMPIATPMLSFADTEGEQKALRLAVLVVGLVGLWLSAKSVGPTDAIPG